MIRDISITWCIEDVQGVDPSLTDLEASSVLERLKNKHDAEVGITWSVIEDTIYWMRDSGEL